MLVRVEQQPDQTVALGSLNQADLEYLGSCRPWERAARATLVLIDPTIDSCTVDICIPEDALLTPTLNLSHKEFAQQFKLAALEREATSHTYDNYKHRSGIVANPFIFGVIRRAMDERYSITTRIPLAISRMKELGIPTELIDKIQWNDPKRSLQENDEILAEIPTEVWTLREEIEQARLDASHTFIEQLPQKLKETYIMFRIAQKVNFEEILIDQWVVTGCVQIAIEQMLTHFPKELYLSERPPDTSELVSTGFYEKWKILFDQMGRPDIEDCLYYWWKQEKESRSDP